MLMGDAFLLLGSYILAYMLRFEFQIPETYRAIINKTLFPIIIFKLMCFYKFKLYKGMWRYTGASDLLNIMRATVFTTMAIMIAVLIMNRFEGYPRSVFLIDAVLTLLFISGFRFAIRLSLASNGNPLSILLGNHCDRGKRLLIVGAGGAGEKIMREIRDNARLEYRTVGFLDDNLDKLGRMIHGVPILGEVAQVKEVAEREGIEEILIAIPSATGRDMKRIVELCEGTRITYKTIPGIGELIKGRVTVKSIRDVSYEDLLGREPVRLEKERIGGYLENRRVLVTGAGGSIGSELCRQIAQYNPESLVLLDRTEKNLYDVEMDMLRNFPYIKYMPVLGDIRHKDQMLKTFEECRPEVVFHAAAYKHVPMMEIHPWEAVYNNILGTKHIVEIADYLGVERFALVSTDKAVNPVNVMGATKRVTELLVQAHAKSRSTKFMAVRFGNVVGSSGSVIPLFKKQIEHGGPITVTHPEMTRYFMTIPEAIQLILQAGSMGKGGEVFILDMGVPVKIADIARDLIRLSGLEPDRDIEMKYIGLRPGEKLYEELVVVDEEIAATEHEKILVLRNGKHSVSIEHLQKKIAELVETADAKDTLGLKRKLQEIVPEYIPRSCNGGPPPLSPKEREHSVDSGSSPRVLYPKFGS